MNKVILCEIIKKNRNGDILVKIKAFHFVQLV